MFPNDDLRKDMKSWKFVELNDQIAKILNYENAQQIKDLCPEINFDEVRVPIHYDQLTEDWQEEIYFDSDSDFLFPVASFFPISNNATLVEDYIFVMSSLEFLNNLPEFSALSTLEIFEILIDLEK